MAQWAVALISNCPLQRFDARLNRCFEDFRITLARGYINALTKFVWSVARLNGNGDEKSVVICRKAFFQYFFIIFRKIFPITEEYDCFEILKNKWNH